MSIKLSTLDQKLVAIERALSRARDDMQSGGAPTDQEMVDYDALKAIAGDIRARQKLPRNDALGALEQELRLMKASLTPGRRGYDHNRMVEVANVVISKWPIIQQALERFQQEEFSQ